MFAYLRKRRYLVSAVIGAASAAALYFYGQKSMESIMNAYLWPARIVNKQEDEQESREGGSQDGAISLVGSMDTHFRFIQGMATPQEELVRLLPKLQVMLNQQTDILQLRSSAAQPQPPACERLRALARLCFTRTLSACWLIPLLELLIRVKLNIIGRHLYLQEKLGALARPLSCANWQGGAVGGDLPPELSPAAIESFMSCDSFLNDMLEWVVGKVTEGVDCVLQGQSLEAEVTPHQLLETMAAMVSEIDNCMCSGSSGGGGKGADKDGSGEAPWPLLLCSTSDESDMATKVQQAAVAGADAYRQAMSWAAAVQELQAELRRALNSQEFSEALRASIELTFQAAAVQVVAAIPQPTSSPSPTPLSTSMEGGTAGAQKLQGAGGSSLEATKGSLPPLMSTRPMARLLKPVQSASDPLIMHAKQTAKEITNLPSVKGLCASIFAAPLSAS